MTNPNDPRQVLATHRRARLQSLADAIAGTFADATVHMPAPASANQDVVSIVLPNGIELSVSLDQGLPDVFFEVVRFKETPTSPLLPFERAAFETSVLTANLTLSAAVDLIGAYRAATRP